MRATTRLATNERPSKRIVELVADAEDVSPAELRPPLYEAVDPDALDALFSRDHLHRSPPECVSFRYNGYAVTVSDDDGTVVELAQSPTSRVDSGQA